MFEVSLADLQDDEVTYRKFKLMVEDVQGKQCLTNFHGLDMTTDKLRSLVKKWQVRFCILYCTNKCFFETMHSFLFHYGNNYAFYHTFMLVFKLAIKIHVTSG